MTTIKDLLDDLLKELIKGEFFSRVDIEDVGEYFADTHNEISKLI